MTTYHPTRREMLAAMAMEGMLANSEGLAKLAHIANRRGIDAPVVVAEAAIEFADALIAELDKPAPPVA